MTQGSASDLIRSDDTELAMNELAKRLKRCSESLQSAREENASNLKRDAMLGALGATVMFLRSFDHFNDHRLCDPLVLLQSCMIDLTRGLVNPLFQLENPSNADDWETKKFKFHCAVALQELMLAGMQRMEAAKYVARLLPSLDLRPGTIADWRDNLIGRSDDDFAKAFQRVFEKARGLEERSLQKAQGDFVDFFKNYDLSNVNLRHRKN